MMMREALITLFEVLRTFRVEGDPEWPLSRLREILTDVYRTLSLTYCNMTSLERLNVVKLLLFEACRQHLRSIDGDQAALERYATMIRWCQSLEGSENSICTSLKFFETADNGCILEADMVAGGYDNCQAFNNLSQNPSIEAQVEMQTFLHDNELEVRNLGRHIQSYVLNPPGRQFWDDIETDI